jgi:hypothetical protein
VSSYQQALRMTARSDLVAFLPGRLIAALAGPAKPPNRIATAIAR